MKKVFFVLCCFSLFAAGILADHWLTSSGGKIGGIIAFGLLSICSAIWYATETIVEEIKKKH